jgi:hypothetical protein
VIEYMVVDAAIFFFLDAAIFILPVLILEYAYVYPIFPGRVTMTEHRYGGA